MKNMSGSNAGLALKCAWWLTDIAEHEPVIQTPAMREGLALHALIENCIKGHDHTLVDVSSIFKLAPAMRKRVERKFATWERWSSTADFGAWQTEKAYALDVFSQEARVLPPTENPWERYKLVDRARELTVVCDVVDATKEDSDGPYIDVWEWKSGRPNPKDYDQAQLCAAVAARCAGIERAVAHVVYIGEEDLSVNRREYDSFDLAGICNRMLRVFGAAQNGAEPSPGEHCKSMYCRAQKSCMKWRIEHEPANERVALVTIDDIAGE